MTNLAQRRPGPQPRRHWSQRSCGASSTADAQTKAGASTPATPTPSGSAGLTVSAQRRPGPQPRRHSRPSPLSMMQRLAAQRRPGPQPRRHGEHLDDVLDVHPRSTKAGASTPATHIDLAHENTASPAQRRPGPQPRRHVAVGVQPGRHLLARSTKAGASTPATRGWTSARGTAAAPLNEGRGLNPGDTHRARRGPACERPRSTKAGASTPADTRRASPT